jgi:hypothetical protein
VGAINRVDAVLLAALALPGVALAETPPDQASLSVQVLDYRDWQPDLDRVRVHSPTVTLELPLAGAWSVRGTVVSDTISGASPRYHTAVSGASRFHERRLAGDVEVTRYFGRSSVAVAAGRSGENDYVSHFLSVHGTASSADQNTTWLYGASVANDRIDPVNGIEAGARKHTTELMAGLTRVLTPHDLVQAVLTHARGRGYFSMPYKYVDNRPAAHDQTTFLLRWHHHVSAGGGTLRASYRYYRDTYGIRAHTLGTEFVQPVWAGFTVTPSLRYHTQGAAEFYFDPVYDAEFGPPFPPGYRFDDTGAHSADQRLAAFGAVTLGLGLEKELGTNTTLKLAVARYRQRGSWRPGGGSPGLAPFDARSVVFGVTVRW